MASATLHLDEAFEIDSIRRDYDLDIEDLGNLHVRITGDWDEVSDAVSIYDPSAQHGRLHR